MSSRFTVAVILAVALASSGWAISKHSAAPALLSPEIHSISFFAPPSITPLWFRGNGEDDPASAENDTPFPNSHLIVDAQWVTPRYSPNSKVQAADIIPVTWAGDGHSYVLMDDGSIYNTRGTTLIARLDGVPPSDDIVPQINFHLIAHDMFVYGCPKSVTPNSCYSVGFTEVNHVFYAVTYDHGYPLVGDHPPGHARIDYSLAPPSRTSWVHGTANFPKPVGSGIVSFVEIGQDASDHGGCSRSQFPDGCIYAIVLHGGYQDPHDIAGIDQFNATEVYLARMAVGTPEDHYQEVADPRNWQWFAGFNATNQPTWVSATDPHLARDIRSLSYPRYSRSGCGVDTADCLFWKEFAGSPGYVNYPRMAYDRALHRYLLTFAYWYYRGFLPATESGPMVQGGAELIVLEAPEPWGPWKFVMRNPYLGSGNGYAPSFPVEWQGPRTPKGQDLWMIWAANFAGCGKPMLVPADLCHGVYGMNLRRLHLTLAGARAAIPRPWYDQDMGFASPGAASFNGGLFQVTGNGNLALRPDPFNQYKDHIDHDAFHYVFRCARGNAELIADLSSWASGRTPHAGPEASAGLMLRESDNVMAYPENKFRGLQLSLGDTFSEAARYGYLGVMSNGSVFFQWRDEGHVSRSPLQSRDCPNGCLLQIVRNDNQIRALIGASRGHWRQVGSHTFSPSLSRSVTLGLVATSDSPNTFPRYATYSGRFDHVAVHFGPIKYERR